MLYAIFAVLVIILDQGVKYWVSGHVPLNLGSVPFIPDILSIVNVHNEGAAFGFLAGSNARIYFIILTAVFTLAVILMLATKFISGSLARWCIVLVTAGGLSNCIDRVIYGYVEDMFKCEFVNFPIFNVADIFITVFALLFVLAILFERDHRKEDYDFDEDYADEEDEEEEEEDERPARRLSRRDKRAARRREEEEDEDEEEEDEEEDEEPARPARRSRFGFRRTSRYEDEDDEEEEDEDDEDDEEEESAPRRRVALPERRKRPSKYDAEFESARARKQAAAAPRSYEEEPETLRYEQEPARRREQETARRYEQEPARRRESEPARRREPAQEAERFQIASREVELDRLRESAPTPAPAYTAPQRPLPEVAPAPAKPSAPAQDDFDLESILAEFK